MTSAPVPLRPEPAIRLRGLTKIFADRVAVNCMNLEVAEGELFGFLGPNGAGKTTTIKLLTGLLRPTLGSAELCGHDVVTDSLRARAVAGYVPDQPALYDKLTGREMLGLSADLYGVPRRVQAAQHARQWGRQRDAAGVDLRVRE